ncbi:hypothetical protein, partial [Klebsiella quasipneumoniae]
VTPKLTGFIIRIVAFRPLTYSRLNKIPPSPSTCCVTVVGRLLAMSEKRAFGYLVYHLKVHEIVRSLQGDIFTMDKEKRQALSPP